MKIISGKYKGQKLNYNKLITRPTINRIKESIFSIIQLKIENAIVLDLFAGSGSLGIEALSRGAKECVFVEKDSQACKILLKNLNKLEIKNYTLIQANYLIALKKLNKKFDLIFLDPPYKYNLTNEIEQLKLIMNKDSIIVYEHEIDLNINYQIIKQKQYGSKKISFLKK